MSQSWPLGFAARSYAWYVHYVRCACFSERKQSGWQAWDVQEMHRLDLVLSQIGRSSLSEQRRGVSAGPDSVSGSAGKSCLFIIAVQLIAETLQFNTVKYFPRWSFE